MAIEIATIFVKDEAEAAFVEGFTAGVEILKRQPGCQGLRWGKRVEPELAYVIQVEWNDVQDHYNFRETEDYKTFGGLFRQHVSKPPEVIHFEPGD